MIINQDSIRAATTGFKTVFQEAFADAPSKWGRVAMEVPSMTSEELYPWLRSWIEINEWLGDRVIQNVSSYDFRMVNKDYEATVGVDRNAITDDRLGIYSPLIQRMGRAAAKFKDRQVFNVLKGGWTIPCYDGQPLIDADHPVGPPGRENSVSNDGGGSGDPWFLIDTSTGVMPVLYQRRAEFDFVALDTQDKEPVFMKKKFLYGTDARMVFGPGVWQVVYGSRQPLEADSYEAARAALSSVIGDDGQPLDLMGDLLVCGSALEGRARDVLVVDRTTGGATNKWQGTAELLVAPWLN